jgi:hypothetical protein
VFLIRIVDLTLSPGPSELGFQGFQDDEGVDIAVEPPTHTEGRLLCPLLARTRLKHRPKRTADGDVVIPDQARVRCQASLERVANLLALKHSARRSIRSPLPSVAFEPETPSEARWLSASEGVLGGTGAAGLHSFGMSIELDARTLKGVDDRWDGISLLAEASNQANAMGAFHEYMRVFERAFAREATGLTSLLVRFLDPRFGYDEIEVGHWFVSLRGPATHADKRNRFLLESDVRPYRARLEQAAYDVVFNKASWRMPDVARRRLWDPSCATTNSQGDGIAVSGTRTRARAMFADRWQSYPLDLKRRWVLPPSWWSGDSALRVQSPLHVVPAEVWRPWQSQESHPT